MSDSVSFVKGVGPRKAELLARLDVKTAGDLLTYYPNRWEDRTHFARLSEVPNGGSAVFSVQVTSAENRRTSTGKVMTRVAVADGSALATITFFNQPWKRDQLLKTRGRPISVYGTISREGFDYSVEIKVIEMDDGTGPSITMGRVVPVYGLTEELAQNAIRRITFDAIPRLASQVDETLPDEIRERHDLIPVKTALEQIHWPDSMEMKDRARRRLAFEELFLLQAALAIRRKHEALELPGIAFDIPDTDLPEFEATLPYSLTNAQKKVIHEIFRDMRGTHPMNRLLQGDVGSGKTVVAAAAIAAAAKAGYQSAMMAPTEILAEQHARNLAELLEPMNLKVEFISGSLSAKSKRTAREQIAGGMYADVAVGTHALIQDTVSFRNLGLVIVDEQHRFGVMQRAALREKGTSPDVLVMTATPIPRTLALVVYGDLDISTIDELPPGRQPIRTHRKRTEDRESVYSGVEKLLAQGRQAYFVCPLVEESEKLQSQAATELYEYLQNRVFRHRRIGLLHGQMPSMEKERIMSAFRAGELDALVATTVIEVGVDVPNATVMVVEDADRFGLSQLHQLRGRVGRGDQKSYCVLIANGGSTESERRLEVMVNTNDGFRIAEEDLQIRGPGEFYGTRQSGMPSLKIANIIDDMDILQLARTEAFTLVDRSPHLDDPELRALKNAVRERFAESVLSTIS